MTLILVSTAVVGSRGRIISDRSLLFARLCLFSLFSSELNIWTAFRQEESVYDFRAFHYELSFLHSLSQNNNLSCAQYCHE